VNDFMTFKDFVEGAEITTIKDTSDQKSKEKPVIEVNQRDRDWSLLSHQVVGSEVL